MIAKQHIQYEGQRQFSRGLSLRMPPHLIQWIKRVFKEIRKYILPTIPIRAVPSFQNNQISFLFKATTTFVLRNFKAVLIFFANIHMNAYQIAILFVLRNAQIFDFIAHLDLLLEINEASISLSQKELAQLAQGRANLKGVAMNKLFFLVPLSVYTRIVNRLLG
jgi:hypothetical protein